MKGKKHGKKIMSKKTASKKGVNPKQVAKQSTGPLGDLGRTDYPSHATVSNAADAELAKLTKGR